MEDKIIMLIIIGGMFTIWMVWLVATVRRTIKEGKYRP